MAGGLSLGTMGKTMWRYHRAGGVARILGGFPLFAYGRRGIPEVLAYCSLCVGALVCKLPFGDLVQAG